MTAANSAAAVHGAAPAPGQPRGRLWPVLAGLACIALGAAMLFLVAYMNNQSRASAERAAQLKRELANSASASQAAPSRSHVLDVPPYYTHLSDVERLLRTAQQLQVRLGTLNFRSEPVEKAGVVLRVMEVRIEDEYPRLKAFVAELLTRLPHLYLDEIRIDQAGEAATKVQATLKLTFVYRTESLLQPDVSSSKGAR